MGRVTSAPAQPTRVVAGQPTQEDLHRMAAAAPDVQITRYGSVNAHTRLAGRCRDTTFWVCDEPFRLSGPTISRGEADRLARLQDDHLARVGAIVVDGQLGPPGALRLPVRLVVESAAARLAGMQRHLMFSPAVDEPAFTPELTVVVTPGLQAPGTVDGTAVAIWLDDGLTRVIGTDFFGETKKAMTRMWAERVFDANGLVLHAACAVVSTRHGPLTMVVVGAPDSGKSSLVMHGHRGMQVAQDDFVGLLPGGVVVPAENGCIEKTRNIDPVQQPLLHRAVTRPDTYLENVPQRGMDLYLDDPDGPPHARAVFPLRTVGGGVDAPLPPLGLLVILEPADDVAPALVRLPLAQAPGYFLLRERRQGLAEPTGRQGNRLAALLATCSPQVLVLNRKACHDRPDRVRGGIAADIVAAVLDGRVEWETDAVSGVDVARSLPPVTDADLLLPRQRYRGSAALREYDELLTARRAERLEYLSGFVGLDPGIVAAVT